MPGAIDQMLGKGPVPPALGPNAKAPSSGKSGPVPPPPGPGATSGGALGHLVAAPPLGSSSSAQPKRSVFGSIVHGIGSALGIVEKAPGALGSAGLELGKELLPGNLSQGGINPLGRTKNNPGGWAGVKQEMPLTAGALGSLGQTVRQIPDTAIGSFEPGVGFGKTNLGRQVKSQGVLNTTLAKAGDVSLLLGGAGLLGEAAGLGRLAEVSRLAEVADAGIKAAGLEGKIASAADAAKLADAAEAAGDANRAENLRSIAGTLSQHDALLSSGPATLGERATQAAVTGSKFGAHVAGAPAEVWLKGAGLAGKGVALIPGAEEYLSGLGERIKNSPIVKARAAEKDVKELAREHLTGETNRLNKGILSGTSAAKAAAGSAPAEAAAILRHTGSADALSALTNLPDDIVAPLLDKHLGPGFTPESLRLAVNPTPEVLKAADLFGKQVIDPREQAFVRQYGNKGQLSEAGLANRAAGVERPFEPLPIPLAKETARLQAAPNARLAAVEAEAQDLIRRNLEPRTGELSPGAAKQVARDQGVTSVRKSIARQLAKQTDETAAATAGRRLTTAEDVAATRLDRLQNEANARLIRNDQNRLATLDERKAGYQGKLAQAADKARNADVVTPPQTRALLIQSRSIAQTLEATGSPEAIAAAKLLPRSVEDLQAAGVEPRYAPGGTVEDRPTGPAQTRGGVSVTRKKLSAERLRQTGTMPSSFDEIAQKLMADSRTTAANEFGAKAAIHIAVQTGVSRAADLFKENPELRGLKGEELASGLRDAGYVPWEPQGTGRTLTGKALETVTPSTPVIPEAYAAKVDMLLKVPDADPKTYGQLRKEIMVKSFDKITSAARTAKLLEPGWQIKKMVGDPAMLAAMGVSPFQFLKHLPEAIKAVRDGDLTSNLGASGEGRLDMAKPTGTVAKAGRFVADKIFTPFQKFDATAREVAYRAKLAEGFSPQAAAVEVRRGLGDLHDLTSTEKNVAKRVVTFFPWQKHLVQTIARLPLEHPAGLAQAVHLINEAHAANPNPSKFDQILTEASDPLNSSILSMLQGSTNPVGTVLSQTNPLLRVLAAGGLGVSGNRGLAPISAPDTAFGSKPVLGYGVTHLPDYLRFLGQQVPLTRTLQDVLNTAPGKNGALPQRFETGQPIKAGTKHTGAVKAETLGATTRMQAILKALGIDQPEPPTLSKSKKKG